MAFLMRFHMQDRNPSYKMFSPFFWKKVNFSFHFTLDIDKVPEASMCLVQKVAYKCILEQHCLHLHWGRILLHLLKFSLRCFTLYRVIMIFTLHSFFAAPQSLERVKVGHYCPSGNNHVVDFLFYQITHSIQFSKEVLWGLEMSLFEKGETSRQIYVLFRPLGDFLTPFMS